jgi:hypothetical protein
MMEAVHTSETSVNNYFTRKYIPEDNTKLHTRRRENLKSHIFSVFDAYVMDKVATFDTEFWPSLRPLLARSV